MKYDRKEIMRRAWEIKKDFDKKAQVDRNGRLRELKELKPEEKAAFSECLKLAWAEFKRAQQLAEELNLSMANALKLAAKEFDISLQRGYNVTWKLWANYGKKRAYFKASGWSKYANSKWYNYVELV